MANNNTPVSQREFSRLLARFDHLENRLRKVELMAAQSNVRRGWTTWFYRALPGITLGVAGIVTGLKL